MDKKKLIMGGVAVILIAGGVFLFTGKSSKGGIKLETAKVGRSTITNTVTATGTVEPVTEVEVRRSPVSSISCTLIITTW